MARAKNRLTKKHILLIGSGAGLFMVCLTVLIFSLLVSGDGPQKKRQLQVVTLLTPPPPPKIEEQPPEQEEEKIAEPEPEEQPNEPEEIADDLPPAEDLGLDADAGLGSDAFGLKAKKGGRNLIGGKGGSIYGWYTGIITADLQERVNKLIQERGGLPEGQWRTIVRLELDIYGNVKKFAIIASSGSDKMDEAVNETLKSADIGEAPPPGMPRVMKLSFSAQG